MDVVRKLPFPEASLQNLEAIGRFISQITGLSFDSGVLIALAIVLIFTTYVSYTILQTLFGYKQVTRTKGKDLLIVGPCNSGKTCLFYRLRADVFPETVSSIEANQKGFRIRGSRNQQQITVTDFPGHARLRGEVLKYLKTARGIIFVVDGTNLELDSVREAADFLYDILTGCVRIRAEPKLLIVSNKQDCANAASAKQIKKLLEKELNILKKTRHSLEVEGADGEEIMLGSDGVDFEFENDAGCEVDFCVASVKSGDMSSIISFIDQLYSS